MHPLSFRVREQAGSQWTTIASYTHLFKQFTGITYKSYQVLRNHLSKLPPGGQLTGTFQHIESGKLVQLDVRFPEGNENCKKPSWRTGPGAKRMQGASTIVRQPSGPETAPKPVLERFVVVEKEQLNPDVNENLQHQSQYAAAGYAHTLWAQLGVSQEEFQAKRDRFGPVREAGCCRSKKDCQFIKEWQDFCTFEGFKLADGKTDYAFARPRYLGAMQPDREINYAPFASIPAFQLPSGEPNYAGIKQLVTADYDSRVIEFFTRWVKAHWEQKSILNTFQKCRRVLSRLAVLQGWYGTYKYRTTKSNGQEMRGVLYDLDCLTALDERIRLELATRSQRWAPHYPTRVTGRPRPFTNRSSHLRCSASASLSTTRAAQARSVMSSASPMSASMYFSTNSAVRSRYLAAFFPLNSCMICNMLLREATSVSCWPRPLNLKVSRSKSSSG